MKIYVASSWRNTVTLDPAIQIMQGLDYDVYDFRADDAFHWSDIDPSVQVKTGEVGMTHSRKIRYLLTHEKARAGFERDMRHLDEADCLVLMLPCGKSAHTEFGYAVAKGKKTVVFLENPCQPELMYSAATEIVDNFHDLLNVLRDFSGRI